LFVDGFYKICQVLRVLAILLWCYFAQFALEDFASWYYYALTDACTLKSCKNHNITNLYIVLNLPKLRQSTNLTKPPNLFPLKPGEAGFKGGAVAE